MSKLSQKIQRLMIFIVIISLLLPALALGAAGSAGTASTTVKIQPALAEIAAESPDEIVRVMVFKADHSDQVEKLVARLGGVIVHDLHIINALTVQAQSTGA